MTLKIFIKKYRISILLLFLFIFLFIYLYFQQWNQEDFDEKSTPLETLRVPGSSRESSISESDAYFLKEVQNKKFELNQDIIDSIIHEDSK